MVDIGVIKLKDPTAQLRAKSEKTI